MRVDQSVPDVLVPEDFYDLKNALCLVVLHCGFVVSECMKADLCKSWILHFEYDLSASSLVALSHYIWVRWEQRLRVFRQGVKHACQFG
jgi:hypothetical protein